MLSELLSDNRLVTAQDVRVECSIIMKETLPTIDIGGIRLP